MSNDSASSSRIVARDAPFRLISNALGRRHYTRRRARMRAENTPRLAIIPDDEIGIEILQYGLYERHLLSLLFDDVLAPFREEFAGKTALDIGANIGNHSVYLSQRFNRVISFEPGAVASHLLQANLSLNKVTNVELHKVGLSDQDTQAALMLNEADNLGSNTVRTGTGENGGEAIQLRRGDAVLETLADLQSIALVKIDVEGHEAEALRGLETTLSRDHPIILFETTGKHGPAGSDALLSLMRGFGYANFYTLAKDLPFPNLRLPIARAAVRAVLGAKYVLEKRESFDDRYYNLAIATAYQDLL